MHQTWLTQSVLTKRDRSLKWGARLDLNGFWIIIFLDIIFQAFKTWKGIFDIFGRVIGSNTYIIKTRRFSNHESRLLSRSHTYAIIVILDLKIHQSMWIHGPFFPKTWTKGHWPLDDLWPHVCWGHMCDSTQGSLCPSPMGIHQCICGYSDQFCKLPHTYTYIHTTYILRTYYVHTTYRMSDHIVSYWTQFRRDNKRENIGCMAIYER